MGLNVILFEPEIAENVGNIIRSCVGFNATLHLIKPYGFFYSSTNPIFKRSSANYIDKIIIKEYDCYDDFLKINNISSKNIFFITRYGQNTPEQCDFKMNKNIYIMFGKESTGINKEILKQNLNMTVRIPSSANVRSLNVSNCVAIFAYEYAKQNNYEGLEISEPHKKVF
ncbi:MAG: tRNA (cytidine(34)-2'-O)-methyltransferase [Mycoplasmataceae bacterium]|jgi:tRNA (cytidine/uridine-2'-O-)-methyltransferase|nr:tRNA (cytidine(34)-2'-O)-methyltransferase [Mycoplasmataceae bacterium]